MPPRLFVYGTLRSGSGSPPARALARGAAMLGPARMPGRLYGLARYPAMRRWHEPGEWVAGELYVIRDPARLYPLLDAYEGREFARVVSRAVLADGREFPACVYEYRWSLPEWRRIASGDSTPGWR